MYIFPSVMQSTLSVILFGYSSDKTALADPLFSGDRNKFSTEFLS